MLRDYVDNIKKTRQVSLSDQIDLNDLTWLGFVTGDHPIFKLFLGDNILTKHFVPKFDLVITDGIIFRNIF